MSIEKLTETEEELKKRIVKGLNTIRSREGRLFNQEINGQNTFREHGVQAYEVVDLLADLEEEIGFSLDDLLTQVRAKYTPKGTNLAYEVENLLMPNELIEYILSQKAA